MRKASPALSIMTALVVVLLAARGADAQQGDGLRRLTGPDTPLRENDRISIIGDSITMQGGFVQRMRAAIAQSEHTADLKVQLFQHGLNGGRVDTIVEGVTPWGKQDPFSTLLEKDRPTAVVIFLGVNDVTQRDAPGPEAFEQGLDKLVAEAGRTGAAVILATPAVAGERHDGTNPQDARMEQYAAIGRKVAAARRATLCDLRKAFLAYLEEHNSENSPRGVLTYDGIHMSAQGNDLLADELSRCLAGALGATRSAAHGR